MSARATVRREVADLAQALNEAEPENGKEAAALGRLQDALSAFCADMGLDEPLFFSS